MSRKPFTPREYQKTAIDFIFSHPRCAIWASMGSGKTLATLTALDILELVKPGPVLVIAPLRVAMNTWPDEAALWSHLSDVVVSDIIGTSAQRLAALQRAATVYTINYENVPWLVEHLGDRWPFRTLVLDEATKVKGTRLKQGAVRGRALAAVAWSHVDRVIELTGTPSPNGLKDLWGQIYFLDRGQRLGRSFEAFSQRWFRPSRDGYGLEPLAHAQAEIQELLKDICLTIDMRDYVDVREPIRNYIRVKLPAKAREQYNAMEDEMFLQLGDHEIEAFNAASRTMKCLQLANGAIYTDETGAWEEVHTEKLQALDEIIEEAAGAPVLVAYHFKADLARLRKAFPAGRVLDQNPQTLRDWNDGKIPLMFAHPASAGHGLSLHHGGNILVFFGLNWNLEEHQQIIERIGPARQAQAGYDRPVFIHYILAARTVDDMVLDRLESKRSVQDILLEAMKQRTPA